MSAFEDPALTPSNHLATLWRELLEIQSIAPEDNFIELGGNSLLSTILSARLEEETGIILDIQDIFQLSFSELTTLLGS